MADWGFWAVAAATSLVAALIVARPLLRRRAGAAPRAAHDAQIFRDQLKTLERELARGVVAPEEAEATRLEISRRLLAADDEASRDAGARPAPAVLSRAVAVLIVVAAPFAATGLYLELGAPGAKDQPLAARGEPGRPDQAEAEKMMAGRLPPPPSSPEVEQFKTLVAQLEDRLAEAPEDVQGLFLYGRSLMNLSRFSEAAKAFGKVIALKEEDADSDTWAGYAEGMILAAGGYVSPEAEAALLQVLKRSPTDPAARYYLGRLHAQQGRVELARSIWGELLASSPNDAPWVAPIREEMAQLGFGEGGTALPGPTREEMQAARSLPEAERQTMVADMVSRLAERLETEGGSVDEWRRLIRSYSVLGKPREAREAMEKARAALAGDPAALSALESDAPPSPTPSSAPSNLAGPSKEDIAAAQQLPAEDRAAMIEGMVARLDDRLRDEGGGPEEWLRLISSYAALGQPEKARAAYADARSAFKDDASALSMLEAAVEGGPRDSAPAAAPSAPTPAAPGANVGPGPTQEDIAAAAEMEPEDRSEMIRGMVSRLHDRLRNEGAAADVNEWGKLMRSYGVLGDSKAIEDAYAEATRIFSGDTTALGYLKQTALLNGVEIK